MTDRMTLDDLAHKAVTDPAELQPADITRLGDFILDHEEHIAFHRRIAGAVTCAPASKGDLTKRLAAHAPQHQQLAADPALVDPAALPADTSGELNQHADQEV